MTITKATRWRVFAGVWIQSLFTSATAFFSLFALPLTGQFGWSSSQFSMAYTIYMFVYCAMGFVGGLLDCMGLTGIRRERVLALLAQKNVPGIQAMAGQGELQRRDADDLVQLMEIYAPLKEGIAQAGALARNNASWEALRQLSVTASILESFGLNGQVRLDFSLVNSMDYYNGVIFQGFLPKIPFPVLSGGRYDNLPRKMGKQVGAIGFALYMGRLEPYFGREKQYDADLMLTYGPDADLADLAAFVEKLRSRGLGVRCQRQGDPVGGGRCRKTERYVRGMKPEEVLV